MKKTMKKLLPLLLAVVMSLAFAGAALAQTVGTAAAGKGSITIENAAKGETYSVVKLFDATLTSDNQGIAYTGDIPESLQSVFEKDSAGNIHVISGQEDNVISKVQEWAESQTATEVTSDGTSLVFQGLDYGYYAVKSSQGTTITIDSTNPNATVYDKNTKDITAEKTVGKESYSIGDTVTYTATFDTVNFYGEGSDAKQVLKYTITDTLPAFLSDVAIDSVVVTKKDGTTEADNLAGKSFTNGSFDIDWADEVSGTSNPKQWTSKYDNGAKIIVTYHGTLTSTANINTANTNTVKIQPTVVKDDGTPDDDKPWDESWQDDAVIKTYGTALKKTDGTNALAGAEFTVAGLTVEAVSGESGVYRVVSYDANSTTPSAAMQTNSNGKLYIIGLGSDVTLAATETKAPDGYNKVGDSISLPARVMNTVIYETSGTRYYDAKGNLVSESSSETTTETVQANYTDLDPNAVEVVNKKGTELPSTGGIGTTIFYIAGSALVLVAGAALFARRVARKQS